MGNFVSQEKGDSHGQSCHPWSSEQLFPYRFLLFEEDILLFPVNESDHWTLMVILIKDRKIIHLDSLTGQPKRSLVSSIMELLCYVHVATYNAPLDTSEWIALNPNKTIPLQRNCDDCGVFLCKYAEYIALERNMDFDQVRVWFPKNNDSQEMLSPCGSWIIRFFPIHCAEESNKDNKETRTLPLYLWSCPDCITDELFNKLMFTVMQIFLEGSYHKLARLIEEPLGAIELIDQFNTFIDATNQDVTELHNQLYEAVHENIQLHVENEQLRYLDLLVTNEFDPTYELRGVLSRMSRNSKSSLLGSTSSTSTMKSKKGKSKCSLLSSTLSTSISKLSPCRKAKVNQISHTNIVEQHLPTTPSEAPLLNISTPLTPSAPCLNNLDKETEPGKNVNAVDRCTYTADEICILHVSDGCKKKNVDNDEIIKNRLSSQQESQENSQGRESCSTTFEDNYNLHCEAGNCLNKQQDNNSISCIGMVGISNESENIENTGMASQNNAACSLQISSAFPSLPSSSAQAFILESKESVDVLTTEQKSAHSSSATNYEANSAPCSSVTAGKEDEVKLQLKELSKKERNCVESHIENSCQVDSNEVGDVICGEVFDTLASCTRHVDTNEHINGDGQVYEEVHPDTRHVESGEHIDNDGQVCDKVYSDTRHDELVEHHKNDAPVSDTCNVPSGTIPADSSEHHSNGSPVKDIFPSPKGHSRPVFLPIYGLSRSGVRCGHSRDNIENNDPVHVYDDVPSGAKYADSSKHCDDDSPVNNTISSPEKHRSDPCAFLPIYGVCCIRKSTEQLCTKTQETELKGKEDEEKVQMPSSSGFVHLPFHGLSRGLLSSRKYKQSETYGKRPLKRKAEEKSCELDLNVAAKRVQLDTNETKAEENTQRNSSGADTDIQGKENQSRHFIDDTENDPDDESSDTENLEWHDALEDVEP